MVQKWFFWKKESNSNDAVYVDLMGWHNQIIGTAFGQILAHKSASGKNNTKSTELRLLGNKQFQEKNWQNAMEFYNQSLRFACDDTENVSLSYANRSACFLFMEMYDRCMIDIGLAKKANYPQRLMHKLIEREATCLKLIEESPQKDEKLEPVLDFVANNQFPDMANVVEIRNSDEFGTHLMANSDIGVGKIILMDKAFVFDATQCQKSYCKNCLKFDQCFIPCPNCSDVMFCDQKCMTSADAIHSMTCGALHHKFPYVTSIIESILIAVNAFPNVNELIEFVEKALATRDFNSPSCDTVMRSKYKVFLKSFTILEDEPNQDGMLRFHTFEMYQLILNIPRAKRYFDTMQKQRFLMHLIWQHHFIIQTNSFAYALSDQSENDIQIMGSISSLFNHSCTPNIALGKYANQTIGYTIRPIQNGQQLFIKYDHEQQSSTQEQQNVLQDRFNFECKCSKCVPCHKQEDRDQMKSDPNYKIIFWIDDDLVSSYEIRSTMKAKCIEFLSKFGHLPWSPEIETASNQLKKCINTEFIVNQF